MRCTRHDLAANADGLCVVCLRDSRAPPARIGTARVLVLLGAAGALIVGGGLIYRSAITPSARGGRAADVSAEPAAPFANVQQGAAREATRDGLEVERRRHEKQEKAQQDLRQAIAAVRVIVYTTSWCPSCKRAKAWLQENAMAFEERDIEASKEFERQRDALGARKAIPTFDVEGEVHVGFAPAQITAMRERAARRKLAR